MAVLFQNTCAALSQQQKLTVLTVIAKDVLQIHTVYQAFFSKVEAQETVFIEIHIKKKSVAGFVA